jgi:Fe2+ or Zn2+ uptake regulation protein
MSKPREILENLRKSGRRVTPQRVMVLEVMEAQGGHIPVEDIYQHVLEKHPYANRSTIYRTLEMLTKEGIVSATDLGKGRVYYELHGDEPHHHMICQACGYVAELDHSLLEPLQETLQRKYKFKANIHHFAIFGLCASCQTKAKKNK